MNLVFIFAIICVICLVWAVHEWDRSRGRDPAAPSDRNGWREGLYGLCLTLVWIGLLWILADANGWSRDRALWLGFGSFVAVMTVVRPRWYWNNYRARWLREAIGDTPAAIFYLGTLAQAQLSNTRLQRPSRAGRCSVRSQRRGAPAPRR